MAAANPKEVEIKFRVSGAAELERKLRALGFRELTPRTLEVNTLYDLPTGALRRRGEVLRIRRYGEAWKVTHKSKGSIGRHKSRVEWETEVSSGDALGRILGALGFRPSFVYEKFRSEWSDGAGHVVLDQTPIGHFAEIEGAPRWIDRIARALGVLPGQYITESYAALFDQWKQSTRSRAQNMTFAEVRDVAPR